MVVRGRLSGVSSRLVLGGLGAGELLASALSGLSPSRAGDIVGRAAASDAAGTVLASLSLVGTELEVLATVAGILFFGYAVYEFLPGVFPQELEVVAGRQGYRLLAVALVLGGAEIFASAVRLGTSQTGQLTLNGFLFAVSSLVACIAYVTSVVYRDAADIEPAARAVSERLDITGPGEGSEAIETESIRARGSHIVSVGLMLAIPTVLLAPAVVAAEQLYPTPELLAITWGVVATVDNQTDRPVIDRLPDRERTDFEGSVFDLVVNAIRSEKGVPTVLVVLLGFLGATVLVGVLNANMTRFAREGVAAVGTNPLFAWSVIGMVVVLVSSGLYAVWFWTRVIRRVPRYLRAWNVANAETSPMADEDLPDSITRPVGLLVPVTVTMLPATAFTQLLRFDYFFASRAMLVVAYAVTWPLSVALLAYCVWRTRRIEPQPPLSDGRALLVALLAEWLVYVLFNPIVAFVGAASDVRYPPSVEGIRAALLLPALAAFIFIQPDVAARTKDADGWRQHGNWLFMAGGGLVCGVAALLNLIPGFGLALGIMAALFVGAPVWEAVSKRVG